MRIVAVLNINFSSPIITDRYHAAAVLGREISPLVFNISRVLRVCHISSSTIFRLRNPADEIADDFGDFNAKTVITVWGTWLPCTVKEPNSSNFDGNSDLQSACARCV